MRADRVSTPPKPIILMIDERLTTTKSNNGITPPLSVNLARRQSLAPFLDRCRTEQLSLVLLMDESLEKLPVEACAVLGGIPSVSRDISLHMLRHR